MGSQGREGDGNQGRLEPAHVSSEYVFVKHGTCEEHGHHFIKTKAECQAAGTSLGVVRKPLTAGGNRQKYCGTFDHNTWLQFNPQASGILNGHAILQSADGFSWQVCRKGNGTPEYVVADAFSPTTCPHGSSKITSEAVCASRRCGWEGVLPLRALCPGLLGRAIRLLQGERGFRLCILQQAPHWCRQWHQKSDLHQASG